MGSNEAPLPSNIIVKYDSLKIPKTSKLSAIDSNIPIIDYFSEKYGLLKSLKTLATVGLSEASPLVKPIWMLSKGQKYRAQLADLILKESPIWLLDEFCADLDPITASIISSKLCKIVKDLGVIAIVAAANNTHFYEVLKPTRVLLFDYGIEPKHLTIKEYKNELY